ncbi:MAG: deoxyguanosinetriphosphate triphosphohydrolase [Bacillota bacterium]|nr:deoxyguanosinetriphosphate triphosphohydrolase [Bacillota bacterium]
MSLREEQEKLEKAILSPYACLSVNSRGRNREETKCEIRTDFVRDRDRIIHCKSFRRLKHKTQVFLSPEGDHYRTRLTHTLEVSQIARTISRALRLNEDLTEAIALGHDLGHTPFGHAGEQVLASVCKSGFTHYEQSLRVVELLENGHKGLNLTYEVRNGIACHTNRVADTLEGQVVKFADKIAYINHDIDDAIRGGVLSVSDIDTDILDMLGHTHSKRINTLVRAVIDGSADKDHIEMLPNIKEAEVALEKFMFEHVYLNPGAKGEEVKAKEVVRMLYEYFLKYPDKMPPEHYSYIDGDGLERVVCDYVAGMTDNYAISIFESLYIPKTWRK